MRRHRSGRRSRAPHGRLWWPAGIGRCASRVSGLDDGGVKVGEHREEGEILLEDVLQPAEFAQ